MNQNPTLSFDNSYARLPEQFYTRQLPDPVSAPGLIRINHALSDFLGIDSDWLASETGLAFVAGNYIADGSDPIATVYAGHQFGGWNPQLGDGRAVLLGELIAADGQRYDIQLKGSGRTPYSRGGDGRAPLGPVLREYIVSEAMAVLGVPTSRALAAVTSGEQVFRNGALPGAVLARVAQSHIRIGTIQYFAARKDYASVKTLVDHVIQRHYPQAAQSGNPVRVMLDAVVEKQAGLIARWQSLGFIHGVMNTDNVLLSGETVDYGPCAFLDEFEPAKVFSSIDQGGRYAYRNQPHIAHWNLGVLAQALLPLLADDQEKALASGQSAIDVFPELYQSAYQQCMCKKLGLAGGTEEDASLIRDLLELMHQESSDYTLTFRRLSDLIEQTDDQSEAVESIFELPVTFDPWLARWRERLNQDAVACRDKQAGMYAVNPVFIARNHLVEETIVAATERDDFGPFNSLVDLLSEPYTFDRKHLRYALPPRPGQQVLQTFCGT
jgi:uncharacterized protein YdiU (UPF0061 family)